VECECRGIDVVFTYTFLPQSLTFHLLCQGTWLNKLVWHRTTKDELLVAAGQWYLNRYTDIKAATNLLILWINNIGVLIAEP
jgi:hypothetical protein